MARTCPTRRCFWTSRTGVFFFFWIEIWPHEFYFVAGLLIMAGLGLFLFTSALGRVWCGYACPQTVWTDLFFTVERWIEGDRNARLRLWRSDWDVRKLRLRVTKYAAWLAIGRGHRRGLGVLLRRTLRRFSWISSPGRPPWSPMSRSES